MRFDRGVPIPAKHLTEEDFAYDASGLPSEEPVYDASGRPVVEGWFDWSKKYLAALRRIRLRFPTMAKDDAINWAMNVASMEGSIDL